MPMKFAAALIFIFCTGVARCQAQTHSCPPPNIGFEEGNFEHWQCDTGTFDQAGVLHLSPSPPMAMRHTLIDKNYPYPKDYYGGFPALCPNGSKYCMVLGNGDLDRGPQAQRISYTFTVPAGASPYSLIFNYAMVEAVRPHTKFSSAFTVSTFDITDSTYIKCSSYDFFVVPGQPKWKPGADGSDYCDWSTAAIDLTGYAGKKVRLEFTTHTGAGDETDYCFAYIDVNENCASPITGNAYCTGQNSVTLTAPPGFDSYVWLNAADLSKEIGFNSTLTISPPPPDQSKYAAVTRSAGCFDTLYTVISKVDAGFVFKVKDTVYTCAETPANLTAANITQGSSDSLNYSYYTDSTAMHYLYFADSVTTGGTYFIKAQSAEGCINILPVTVIVLKNNVVKVTNPAPVVYPATVDITNTYTPQINFSYSYYSNNTGTDAVTDPQHIGVSGTYYIKAVNTFSGCGTLAPVTVVVNPPPQPEVNAPNTFTPNNDGINDHFFVTIIGYDRFTSLKIFNRYGRQVFETLDQSGYWDGTVNGKPANAGTYYWLFEGLNLYYNRKVFQSGSITLIR
jgi:gliding motility-associated-like protein